MKNLENVQGDERDIIIMSVCYGHDADGRMLMNFGPINQRGGEKRLNVIFSPRAASHGGRELDPPRRHHERLQRRREHAAAIPALRGAVVARRSRGGDGARGVHGGTPGGARGHPAPGAALEQLAEALRERGLDVATRLGRSRFRVDLAARRPDADAYPLAVLLDSEAGGNVFEGHLLEPSVLQAFGWRVQHAAAKDWLLEPDALVSPLEPAATDPAAPRSSRSAHRRAMSRGKNGKDRRSFGFAQAFGRGADSAQPCGLSERERTDANGCPESTSWGSLVRAQYRPSTESPAIRDKTLLVPAT